MSKNITHEGEIVGISDGVVQVKIVQNSACGACDVRSACHLSEKKEKVLEIVDSSSSFQPGEKVIIEGSTSTGLRAVFYAFVLPLLLLFFVIAVFLYAFDNEVVAVVSALAFLGVYYVILYFLRERFKNKFVFKIVKGKDYR